MQSKCRVRVRCRFLSRRFLLLWNMQQLKCAHEKRFYLFQNTTKINRKFSHRCRHSIYVCMCPVLNSFLDFFLEGCGGRCENSRLNENHFQVLDALSGSCTILLGELHGDYHSDYLVYALNSKTYARVIIFRFKAAICIWSHVYWHVWLAFFWDPFVRTNTHALR